MTEQRLFKRKAAALYLGMGLTKFDSLGIPVTDADGMYLYDRADLDRWVDLSKKPRRQSA